MNWNVQLHRERIIEKLRDQGIPDIFILDLMKKAIAQLKTEATSSFREIVAPVHLFVCDIDAKIDSDLTIHACFYFNETSINGKKYRYVWEASANVC
ncbi:MAG: hypothetical protein SFX18_13355 [Pirellulales bacterium]|nr:hypothetical protein [Pirellulales bacterium]